MIYLAFEGFLVGNMWRFRLLAIRTEIRFDHRCTYITTAPNGRYNSFEAAIGWIIDDPASLPVLYNRRDTRIELRAFLQTVALPQLRDLGNNLLAVRVSLTPFDRWVEAVHNGVYLESRGIVHSLRSLSAHTTSYEELDSIFICRARALESFMHH